MAGGTTPAGTSPGSWPSHRTSSSPTYARHPEWRPAEPLWPLVREGLANKAFPTLAALTDPLERRCRWMAGDTGTAKGTAGFHWAVRLER